MSIKDFDLGSFHRFRTHSVADAQSTDLFQHEWFLSSRVSQTSAEGDRYIWKPPSGFDSDGIPLPPNNRSQILGEANSAWSYDPQTKEIFLSLFTPSQRDLNWDNPAVRAPVHDVMAFWTERGACDYRMDVVNLMSKDQRLSDAEPSLRKDRRCHFSRKFCSNGSRIHEYLLKIHGKC